MLCSLRKDYVLCNLALKVALSSSVLDFINININSVTTLKRITTFPNQKPWMNREVRVLLKARDTAFRSGDAQTYSSSRVGLKRGIKKAKHSHKLRIEEHFKNNSESRRMRQGMCWAAD